MVKANKIQIEVAYASPTKQLIIPLLVSPDTTVEEAIHLSGILLQFPEIDLIKNDVGIFSQKVQLSAKLAEHDRVEIYRSLMADPKQARRNRVVKQIR